MKTNPIELAGFVLIVCGGLWSWIKGSAVAGLPVIETGILFVLIGALVGWFFSKQK